MHVDAPAVARRRLERHVQLQQRTSLRAVHDLTGELDLPERVVHILQRHGVRTVRAAEQLDPAAFHLMANMAPRDIEAVARAIRLWRYRRWQEAGFPAGGD